MRGNRSMLEYSWTFYNIGEQCLTMLNGRPHDWIFLGEHVSTKIHRCCSTKVASCKRGLIPYFVRYTFGKPVVGTAAVVVSLGNRRMAWPSESVWNLILLILQIFIIIRQSRAFDHGDTLLNCASPHVENMKPVFTSSRWPHPVHYFCKYVRVQDGRPTVWSVVNSKLVWLMQFFMRVMKRPVALVGQKMDISDQMSASIAFLLFPDNYFIVNWNSRD